MSQIQISLPNEPKSITESLITALNERLKIKNMILLEGNNNSLAIIRCQKNSVPRVLEVLNELGIGIEYGIIDILKLQVTIPELEEEQIDVSEEISSRVSVEEIESTIKEGMELNIDFYLFIIIAAFIAGAGLILNSTAIIIGSMIISPLMGPILGVSYGMISKNYNLVKKGIFGQLISVIIAIGIGVLLASLAFLIYSSPSITNEMMSRNFPTIFDLIVSIGAGLAVGFAITGKIQSSLVGIAIAVSLMPPAVNIGVTLIYGNLFLSLGSFVLLMSNILAINLMAILIFKLKKIKILEKKYLFWKGPEEKVGQISLGVKIVKKKPKKAK
ncbi:MAG: TIGR00341 family protein [Candidatus Hodarchaeota archaeon]